MGKMACGWWGEGRMCMGDQLLARGGWEVQEGAYGGAGSALRGKAKVDGGRAPGRVWVLKVGEVPVRRAV